MIIMTTDKEEKVLDLNKTAACLWEKSDRLAGRLERLWNTCAGRMTWTRRPHSLTSSDFIEAMKKKNLLAVSEAAI